MTAEGLLGDNAHSGTLGPYKATPRWKLPLWGTSFGVLNGPALLVSPTALTPAMKAMMREFLRFDSRAWVGTLDVPTPVIAGGSDPLLPVHHARAVHDAIAGSHFAEVPGAGHVPLAQRRLEVREAFRRFLAERVGFRRGD